MYDSNKLITIVFIKPVDKVMFLKINLLTFISNFLLLHYHTIHISLLLHADLEMEWINKCNKLFNGFLSEWCLSLKVLGKSVGG